MNCCSCGKKLKYIEDYKQYESASTITIDSGYMSKYDADVRKGWICDDCIKELKHLDVKNWLTGEES
jgi:hypothetical protein